MLSLESVFSAATGEDPEDDEDTDDDDDDEDDDDDDDDKVEFLPRSWSSCWSSRREEELVAYDEQERESHAVELDRAFHLLLGRRKDGEVKDK
mmetsp:Transcript_3928/g.9601  ORF Transcript_3928/g.9601 Transcript_3928/m.9601 type:complete len:93 (+) Transcript_3928:3423-3701(+)